MEHAELRDLIDAHALDALDADERALVDEHVAGCAECAARLDELRETAAALAFAAPEAAPPPGLRAAILDAAAPPRPVPAKPPHRLALWRGLAIGLAAACAGLAALAIVLWNRADSARSSRDAQAAALAQVLQPGARLVALQGAPGAVVGTPQGRAILILGRLHRAPSGKTYEAWLIGGAGPRPAGTFAGGSTVLRLAGPAPRGTTVAVTVEPAPGSRAPTSAPFAKATL
jgi:anti-sigma-K factor RskA